MRWLLLVLLAVFVSSASRLSAQEQVAEPPAAETANVEAANVETANAADATTHSEGEKYLRISKSDEGKSLAMQTAIVRYVGQPNTKYADRIVDLVGVVHIGEGSYYADLGERLSTYDTVLYELVAPDGTRIRPEDLEGRRSLLSSMQSGMKDMLNLQYQLEKIDYMSTNFRHADMSPDEFTQDLERRGDSIWKMVARMMGAGLASQSASGGDAGILFALFSDDRSKRMKQVMARQLIDMETVTAGMDDENGENTLIKGRNVKAFKILREELDAGKKEVAVFYGAGHLIDMAQRLENDFEMSATETTWLDAWDLTRN